MGSLHCHAEQTDTGDPVYANLAAEGSPLDTRLVRNFKRKFELH